jgi:hypothetical protein
MDANLVTQFYGPDHTATGWFGTSLLGPPGDFHS